MVPRLTEDDEGKRIVTASGDELGTIVEVQEGTPYVDPDPDVLEEVQVAFDWGEPEDDAYPLPTVDVAEVTDDEVHLR